MRSQNVDRFNHDEDAADYDRDVLNESDPIRAGYDALLGWIAAQLPPGAEVVDLGSGTGNLAARIERPARLVCVDVSEKMTAIAREKLAGLPCEFVRADLLECFAQIPVVDAIGRDYTRAGRQALVDDIREEFFWHLDAAVGQLRSLGFAVTTKRFSALSWGIVADKPAP